tara:strand:- start:59 stop:1444 length:1386 start_codon:yes stop_codon:yes gene_type:complete
MASAAGQPNYGKFQVLKKRALNPLLTYAYDPYDLYSMEAVDIKGKVVGFNYYESLYSPMVTASFLEVDTGGTVNSQKDDFAGTLKDGLPVKGFEEVLVKVNTKYVSLDWTKRNRRFVITGSPYNIDEGNRQTAYFPMVSINAMKSTSKPVKQIYPEAKISDIVKKILDDAKLPYKDENIESTQNSMKVDAQNENPLDTILKLCPKSIPFGGQAGFFFYENSEGYNFKSIHNMIKDGKEFLSSPERSINFRYIYERGLKANLDNDDNDRHVLAPPTVRRDQDQLNAIKMGIYNIKVCTRNIVTGEVTEEIINVYNNKSVETLGNKTKDDLNNDQTSSSNEGKNKNYCKTYTYQLIPGVTESGVSNEISNNPAKYHPQAIMRYGLIHAQLVNIIVPHNGNLTVGRCIRLAIENVTADNKIEKKYNDHRSGDYLILHLCHAFTPTNSFTSLTLIRDEYGLPSKK